LKVPVPVDVQFYRSLIPVVGPHIACNGTLVWYVPPKNPIITQATGMPLIKKPDMLQLSPLIFNGSLPHSLECIDFAISGNNDASGNYFQITKSGSVVQTLDNKGQVHYVLSSNGDIIFKLD
jgi:hypothetical protein